MFAAILGLVILYLFSVYILAPIVTYIIDPKNLRRYPTFHPLSGVSDLPFLFSAQRGFRSRELYELHKVHPVLRIGPNALSYADPGAIKDIYGHGTACVKDRFYSETSGSHSHLADVVDKQDHARKRKVLSSAYAIKNLEEWEYKVADLVGRLTRAFDGLCTKPPTVNPANEVYIPGGEGLTVDYRFWSNMFTVAAIANIGLSEDLGFLEAGSDRITSESMDGATKEVSFKECISATAKATYTLVWAYDWYPTLVRLSKIVSPYYRKLWKLDADWNGIVYNRVTTRLKRYIAGEKLDDFFTAMMEDKKGAPHSLEMGEIVAEISIMMNAGSDTTAIALRNVMFFLLKNPRCMQTLREELDDVLDEDEVVAPYSKVKHLPYLRACLDESLRMLPPVIFGLPRRTPPEGTQILGDFIAGDTSVSMSAYVVHHNESIFKDHDIYQPERWLGDAGKSLQSYFIPFSTGARGCIGRNISYLEQTVLLASLVHRYDFALPSPDWDPPVPETTNLSPGPMPLKIWRSASID
ncbi:cytochrome P450 [Aspergillus karnatakaensis]|uniref:cytochrome P450 n=1 Tax=Aspergillus karnatakaensis TaxID=1810916 RepID=UPI003CCD8D98